MVCFVSKKLVEIGVKVLICDVKGLIEKVLNVFKYNVDVSVNVLDGKGKVA